MFRFVFLASIGVLALRPAFGDESSLPVMTPAIAPASAIARSDFALGQRDAIRAKPVVSRPVLQASAPIGIKPATSGKRFASRISKVVRLAVPASPLAEKATASAPALSAHLSPVRGPVLAPNAPVAPLRSSTLHPALEVRTLPAPGKLARQPVAPSAKPAGSLLAALPPAESKTTMRMEPPVTRALRPGPKVLSSREMKMLRRFDSTLAGEQVSLSRTENRLTSWQRQLGVVTSVLNTAMMRTGDEGVGLNPFVRVAVRYRGTPYVWGGETGRGFDCSGFIMCVMRDLGYHALPHSAAEQFNYGLPVARELLKPGDIVFFANTYKAGVSHVGIYLGHRQFIHAANSKVGTIVSSIDDTKWIEHYAGARRLLVTRS